MNVYEYLTNIVARTAFIHGGLPVRAYAFAGHRLCSNNVNVWEYHLIFEIWYQMYETMCGLDTL